MTRKYFYLARDKEPISIIFSKVKLKIKTSLSSGKGYWDDSLIGTSKCNTFCFEDFMKTIPYFKKRLRAFEQIKVYTDDLRYRVITSNGSKMKNNDKGFTIRSLFYVARNEDRYYFSRTEMKSHSTSGEFVGNPWAMDADVWEYISTIKLPKGVQIAIDMTSLKIEKMNYYKDGGSDVLSHV